jgi:SAM-dependent methyltransferase
MSSSALTPTSLVPFVHSVVKLSKRGSAHNSAQVLLKLGERWGCRAFAMSLNTVKRVRQALRRWWGGGGVDRQAARTPPPGAHRRVNIAGRGRSLDQRRQGDDVLPQIWRGSFDSAAAWRAATSDFLTFHHLADHLDDAILRSRHPFTLDAWCTVCQTIQPMLISWSLSAQSEGSISPLWTETALCPGCGLNSRMRAVMTYLDILGLPSDSTVYIAERVTPSYMRLERRFAHVTGSEYLGDDILSGTEVRRGGILIRHEDMTKLSFSADSFDVIVTMDVFEHIPDYRAAFRECRRVLRVGGHMVFTIPFYQDQDETVVLASVAPDGSLTHHSSPEYHGNPVGDGRSLCFQHFGWDLLDDLNAAGFASATANLYWGPWQGHMGSPVFVFHAHA